MGSYKETILDVLERREVVTTDPARADECCGIERDEDGFCVHRSGHPIYIPRGV